MNTEKRPFSRTILLIYFLIAGTLVFLTAPRTTSPSRTVSYSEFLKQARNGSLSKVEITDTQFVGTVKTPEGSSEPAQVSTSRPVSMDESWLLQELAAGGAEITVRRGSGNWGNALPWYLGLLLVVIFLPMLAGRQRMTQISSVGKSKAKLYDQYSHSTVSFSDVAGVDEAEAELVEVVDFLKNPQKYTKLGGRIPKGVLLVGPPGTGKTLLAKAISGEANVPFFSISGSEFMEIFVGVGAARVRDLFEQAKQRAPCIIFIDELDAIGKSRASGRGVLFNNEEREQTLNQLLAEMDGFDSSSGVIIMAATNTPEVLDQALLRAGRFDRQIVVDRPDIDGREAILKLHARKVKLGSSVDMRKIAARTPGMVGADLANIVNEAALLAARHHADAIEMRDIEEAIDRVMLGMERKSRVMSPGEKERVAYHESGHALIALSVEHANPVHRVSIIPRSIGALGHTLQLPTEDRFLMTRTELLDQLTVMLGGRAAEEITFHGEVSTGAADDLERASELARQMVTRFGMSAHMGTLTYGKPLAGRFLRSPFSLEERNYSERTAEMIDDEVRTLVEQSYRRSLDILNGRHGELIRIARELIQRETLDRPALDQLLHETTAA